ncbi:MAG: class I SAM-dependent methyltransferase [Pseudanabaena sp. CAN_BIN31]|nr:class I SAM-dependent methyltransferase [Pseudanabaena sp. CAN_BIN31]
MNQSLVYSWQEAVSHISVNERWQDATKYLTPTEILNGITIQQIWSIIDRAWDELEEENNQKQQGKFDLLEFLHDYYQHPVWLINAAFSESDPATIEDRLAAIRLISHVKPRKILDFGGGIGTVARLCANQIPEAESIDLVDITEFRHTIQQYLADYSSVRVLKEPEPLYDAVICTEVLEHLTDPIAAVADINRMLRVGGAFSTSYSFVPVIKCHLPQNFHLQFSMLWIIRSLGFGFYGFERRGSTVYSFVKHSEVTDSNLKFARSLESLSRLKLPLNRLFLLFRTL